MAVLEQVRGTKMKNEVIPTIDFGVLVMNEQRFCDADYIDEIFEKAARRHIKTILWRTLGGPYGLYRSRSVPAPAWQDLRPRLVRPYRKAHPFL